MMPEMHKVVKAAFDEITESDKFYTTKNTGSPHLLVMSGLPMSGKSYLSNIIEEKLDGNICIVRTDFFRPTVAKHMGRNEPVYTNNEHEHVFTLGHELAKKALENNWNVIADATNLTEQFRKWAIDAGKDKADQILVAFLEISHETAMDRNIEKDRSGSAATPAVYAILNFEKEPMEKCSMPYIVINAEIDVRPWAEEFAKWFRGDTERVPRTMMPKTKERPRSRLK